MGLSPYYNLILRGVNDLIKLIFIIFLSNYLSLSELGTYGLLTSIISYGILIFGFDAYIIYNRNNVGLNSTYLIKNLSDQFSTYITIYSFSIPCLFIVNFFFLSQNFLIFILIIFITISDHLATELYRIQNILNKQLKATFSLLLRQSFWMLFLISIVYYEILDINLYLLLLIWFSFSIISNFISYFNSKEIFKYLKISVNFNLIKNYFKVFSLFFIGTLSLRGLFVFDRFAFNFFNFADDLGIYVFFTGLAMVIINFIDTAVVSFYKPILLIHKDEDNLFKKNLFAFSSKILFCIGISFFFFYFFLPTILNFTNKSVFFEKIHYFWFIFSFVTILSLHFIPNIYLYAKQLDKESYLSNIICLPMFFFILFFFNYTPLAIITSLFVVLFLSFIIKVILCIIHNLKLND